MTITRPTIEQIQAFAFKTAVFGVTVTILIIFVGGMHYLSTTNNFTQPGSLAVLGYVGYPLVTAILATVAGILCSVWVEWQTRLSRRERRANDDKPSTRDILNDRK